MTPRHQVSRAAIELIKRFEGYRRKAAQLPDGRWTIGYGHTLTARQGAEVSEADAEALLLYDLIGVSHAVGERVYADLSPNQFDALCAFAFSIGLDAFRGSDVLKRVNEGAFTQAAFALELWRKAEFAGERIVVDALVRRRAAEKLLFLTPQNGAWRAVPSAVLRPELDEAAPDTAPRGTPVQLQASLDGGAVSVTRDRAAEEVESPVRAAAEAVTARLQTLFAEPSPPSSEHPAAAVEDAVLEPEPAAPGPSFGEAQAEADPDSPPPPDPGPEAEEAAPKVFRHGLAKDPPARRVIIDDTAPYEFVPAPVQPIDDEHGDSLLAIVSLLVLGLAFFGGGVFWALNARPAPSSAFFTPLLVGWLAGVAGVGFVAASVFMLLQRVTRSAEQDADRRN